MEHNRTTTLPVGPRPTDREENELRHVEDDRFGFIHGRLLQGSIFTYDCPACGDGHRVVVDVKARVHRYLGPYYVLCKGSLQCLNLRLYLGEVSRIENS